MTIHLNHNPNFITIKIFLINYLLLILHNLEELKATCFYLKLLYKNKTPKWRKSWITLEYAPNFFLLNTYLASFLHFFLRKLFIEFGTFFYLISILTHLSLMLTNLRLLLLLYCLLFYRNVKITLLKLLLLNSFKRYSNFIVKHKKLKIIKYINKR